MLYLIAVPMPVFLVSVNTWAVTGHPLAMPELLGVVTTEATPSDAVTWLLLEQEEDFARDVECVLLTARDDCWFAWGPETPQ